MKLATLIVAAAAVLANPVAHAADPLEISDPAASSLQMRLSLPFGGAAPEALRLGLAWQRPDSDGARPFSTVALETSLTGPQQLWLNGKPLAPYAPQNNAAADGVTTAIIVVGVICVVALILVLDGADNNGRGNGY